MAPKLKKADKTVEEVIARNDFYRSGFASQRKLMLILGAGLVLSVLFNIILFSVKPDVRVIAIDNDGRVVPVVALSEPMVSSAVLTGWVLERVVELNTYDFRNWRKSFQASSSDFTTHGWLEFSKAMKKSNNIELLKQDQLFVSAVPQGAPVIVKEGNLNGRYAWRVEFPMLVTYEGASDVKHQKLMMSVTVVRADLVNHPIGLAIEQVVSRDSK